MVFYLGYSMIVSNFIILKKKEIENEINMKKTWFGEFIGKLIAVLLIMNTLASLQVYAAVTPVRRNDTVKSTVVEQKELRGVWFSYIDWSDIKCQVLMYKKSYIKMHNYSDLVI